MRVKKRRYPILSQVIVLIFLLVYIYPFYMMVSFSFKTMIEMLNHPFALPQTIQFSNYVEAWKISNFSNALLNSAFISFTSVFIIILIGSMAAYFIARRGTKLAGFLYLFFLAGIMIPIQLDLVPLFALVHDLGISHSRLGIVCLYVAFAMPLTVFFYAGFLRTVPLEVEEAAEIDGCSQWRCYFQIVFPLMQPVTSTVFILQFLAVWNDFFLPVIFLNTPDLRTVQVAIYSFLGRYSNDWVHMFPILVLGMLPVLLIYLFLQKYIVSGIMAGSIKG